MLTCRQLTELVTDYLEGDMTRWERVRFQLHLGMCCHCRAYLRQMKQAVAVVGHVQPPAIPGEVRGELRLRFRNWKRT